MIKNKHQYSQYKSEIKKLEQNISDLNEVIEKNKDINPELKLQLSGFNRLLSKKEKKVDEYEKLISGNLDVLEFDSFKDDMNKAIMSFRIASKLTQKEIAELMYIHEQQIQRYEQQDYLSASFERILQLLDALGIQVILKKKFNREEIESDLSEFLLPGTKEKIREISVITSERRQLVKY